jgi:ketosteroid isomerase-like protein
MQSNQGVIAEFIRAINDRRVDRIVALSSDDHAFVDAHGGAISRDKLADAWSAYFEFMPHYTVIAEQVLVDGDWIAVFGSASGSLDRENADLRAWTRPCAWRALVRDGQIALWQVYVDTKAVFDLL